MVQEMMVMRKAKKSDPFWNDVVLLLDFEAPVGSTAFTDYKGHVVSSTAPATDARKAFGNTSARHTGAGTVVQIENHPDFDLGITDFTIEGWVNWRAGGSFFGGVFIGRWGQGSNGADFLIQLTNEKKVSWDGAGVYLLSTIGVPDSEAMTHIAVVRWNNVLYIYIDGQSAGSVAMPGRISYGTRPLRTSRWDDGNSGLLGDIDELRITKRALYKAPFQVPDKAFLTS